MNFIEKMGFRSGLNLVVGHKSRSRRCSETLGSLLAKQNPSLNETLDEVCKEKKEGVSPSHQVAAESNPRRPSLPQYGL